MGALIGMVFATGVLLAMSARSRPVPQAAPDSLARLRRRRRATALGIGLAAGTVALVVTRLPVVGVLAFVLGTCVPHLAGQRGARRRADERRAAWPDVIDGLAGAVRAGLSLPESVCSVAESGPECLRPSFVAFAAHYRVTGDFGDAAVRLRDRLADPVGDRVIEALLTARDVGGHDLGRILRSMSEFVRQELRHRGEAEARQTWMVNGARLAAVAPWLVLAFLSSRPGTVEAYRSTLGTVILVASATATVVAYAAMLKIGRLPEEPRVLVTRGQSA